MVSRYYRTYKFLYTDDYNRQSIKRQQVYLDNTGNEVTPITSLFLARLVPGTGKVEGSSRDLRHLLAYIGDGSFKANIPYSPLTELATLRSHIEEILAVERVICGDYHGESNNQTF
jgi:hypothetical protein